MNTIIAPSPAAPLLSPTPERPTRGSAFRAKRPSLHSAARETAGAPMALDRMACNAPLTIVRIDAVAAAQPPERGRQLADIGFLPGERVVILTRAAGGGGRMVVQVGPSRFALRDAEAACVLVRDAA